MSPEHPAMTSRKELGLQVPGDVLRHCIRALWRRRFLILTAAFLAALASFLIVTIRDPVFEARATLLVQRPQFSTELKPEPLSVETYRSFVQSDFVISKLVAMLTRDNVLSAATPLETFRQDLSVEIYAYQETDRPGTREYMPILDLVARANAPEEAAAIANSWAEMFLSESAGLLGQARQGNLDFIDNQYPEVSRNLEQREAVVREKQDFYDGGLQKLEEQWERRILAAREKNATEQANYLNESARMETEYGNETARLISEYDQETERLKLEFLSRWKPDKLKAEQEVNLSKLVELQDQLLDVSLSIKTERDILEKLKEQIQQQPRFLVLSKAITDEALWDRIGSAQPDRLLEKLQDLKLKSDQINPAHTHLLDRLIETQISYETLGPKRDHLVTELEKLEQEIEHLTNLNTEKQIAFSRLVSDRELGAETLKKNRALGLTELEHTRRFGLTTLRELQETELKLLQSAMNTEVTRLKRERDLVLDQTNRVQQSVRKTYDVLADKHVAAQLARAESVSDLALGSRAVTPGKPLPSGRLFKSLWALFAGLIISSMIVLTLEYLPEVGDEAAPPADAGNRVNLETATPRRRWLVRRG